MPVLTRQQVIRLLDTVMVAPITPTIRGAPSEVIVGPAEGLKRELRENTAIQSPPPLVRSLPT